MEFSKIASRRHPLVFFRMGALAASTLAIPLRQTIAILLRQILTSNPFRGESLFASTEQPVYRLEPSPEEREPRERWSLS